MLDNGSRLILMSIACAESLDRDVTPFIPNPISCLSASSDTIVMLVDSGGMSQGYMYNARLHRRRYRDTFRGRMTKLEVRSQF